MQRIDVCRLFTVCFLYHELISQTQNPLHLHHWTIYDFNRTLIAKGILCLNRRNYNNYIIIFKHHFRVTASSITIHLCHRDNHLCSRGILGVSSVRKHILDESVSDSRLKYCPRYFFRSYASWSETVAVVYFVRLNVIEMYHRKFIITNLPSAFTQHYGRRMTNLKLLISKLVINCECKLRVTFV